ncbi:MAG TPA: hypothetical protein VFY39_03365 [Gammaproteobacteria bacterium]|nr:hypothetical protein [Gammaproteobacteria bacterium]
MSAASTGGRGNARRPALFERVNRGSSRTRSALRQARQNLGAALAAASGRAEPWTWKRFHREVRSSGRPLLARLGQFPEAVLVAGCQRSGTTALARVIRRSEGFVDYAAPDRDDELDAALILAGIERHAPRGRYCFQTTYLNERYGEYLDERGEHQLVWVLRNPYSVVYSMLYNWEPFAFGELFEACGYPLLEEQERRAYDRYGRLAVSKLRRACLAYAGKELQALDLARALGANRMLVADYDLMVHDREAALAEIYAFIRLPFKPHYADLIHARSLGKADLLSAREKELIGETCGRIYEELRALARAPGSRRSGVQ